MANYVYNTLTIAPEHASVIVNKKGEVDFGIICPMPKALDVQSGGTNDEDIYVYLSKKLIIPFTTVLKNPYVGLMRMPTHAVTKAREIPLNSDDLNAAYKRGSVLVRNFIKYGAITWYEWCHEHWGTKWNAFDCSVKLEQDYTELKFTTAWTPPKAWLRKLSKTGISFCCEWKNENGASGSISYDSWHKEWEEETL